MKIGAVDRDQHLGDPRFVDVPVERLLSKQHAAAMAERIKRGEKTSVPRLAAKEAADTTQVCVVDRSGMCVSLTHTLGTPSGVVTDGLGFMYNGAMGAFDPRPGRAASIAPGKARVSSMAPSIVFRDGKPFFVVGAPGGTYITPGILQAILNVVDFGMSALEAISAPRFCATSDTIWLTNRILRSAERDLKGRGYPVKRSAQTYYFAGVHGIRIVDGVCDGAADPGPRRHGARGVATAGANPRPAKRGEGGEQRTCEPGEPCVSRQVPRLRAAPSPARRRIGATRAKSILQLPLPLGRGLRGIARSGLAGDAHLVAVRDAVRRAFDDAVLRGEAGAISTSRPRSREIVTGLSTMRSSALDGRDTQPALIEDQRARRHMDRGFRVRQRRAAHWRTRRSSARPSALSTTSSMRVVPDAMSTDCAEASTVAANVCARIFRHRDLRLGADPDARHVVLRHVDVDAQPGACPTPRTAPRPPPPALISAPTSVVRDVTRPSNGAMMRL